MMYVATIAAEMHVGRTCVDMCATLSGAMS